MKKKGITQYTLIKKYRISAGQLSRLRDNSYVSTHTIDVLCNILDCNVEDIMTHTPDPPVSDRPNTANEKTDEELNKDQPSANA